jgi:hypothetical protein
MTDQDEQINVDRTWRPSQLTYMIPWQSSGFLLWGHLKTLVHSAPISELDVLQQRVENTCQKIRVKPGIFDRVHTLSNKELKVVLKFMGATYSICCRDHTSVAHSSTGNVFWKYVDCDSFAHLSEYYTPLKLVTLFLTLCIVHKNTWSFDLVNYLNNFKFLPLFNNYWWHN